MMRRREHDGQQDAIKRGRDHGIERDLTVFFPGDVIKAGDVIVIMA